MRITLLVDNETVRSDLQAEHGLALWIDTGAHRVLFDTGSSPGLVSNALQLGIDLARTDAIALSHGHYDHSGGLAAVLALAPHARLYLHADALRSRYSIHPARPAREIGMPDDIRRAVETHQGPVIWVDGTTPVCPGVALTGPVLRTTSYEDTGGPFFLDADARLRDLLIDDQSVWLNTPKGLVVLLGCAHSGVVNTLQSVKRASPSAKLHAVIGGMHLANADTTRLYRTAAYLQAQGLALVGPCHCTGAAAVQYLTRALPGKVVPLHAGDTLDL